MGDDPATVLMRGGSLIVGPDGAILAGPDFGGETILYAVIDPGEIVRGKYDFDVVGHYARPDVFRLTVDETPKAPVVRRGEPVEFDLRALPRAARYKILGSCITPRPIAWITSLSADGVRNAAPYSFFNMVGDDPPTIVVGLLAHREARAKDTANNIITTGEFVVNLVDEAHGAAMNMTCAEAAPEVDEIALAGLEVVPGVVVAAPRIATAPASFECRSIQIVGTGVRQFVVIAEVLYAHVRDAFVVDPERYYVDTLGMNLLARMHGAGWYSRQTDLLHMERPG